MNQAQYLIDTSALARLFAKPDSLIEWDRAMQAGVIAVSPVTELEFLYSARSKADRERMVRDLNEMLVPAPFDERHNARAWQVQALLTQHGEHRSAGAVDLLVAACAEVAGLTLLHYDQDFETIARRTGQPTRWVAEPGSL
ncbi:PIN domain-containing protein [Nocardiopsis gilva YIM 90087]|uniref:Ribonuclease VapC n=1 Tax=Nocardiopsis gilva YIM 90087 TaxID=1235441 RepID=A0A223S4R3_9ACTN|nr:PIN domain nuclease [Nocardiopsis gilva]ASU83123.1 PIN domain-containing protein [Nocardiopsis gilva YIM 90087]